MADETPNPEMPTEEPPAEKPEEKPRAVWEKRTEFRINQQMKSLVEATIKVTEAQIALLRRKVEKLQYGS